MSARHLIATALATLALPILALAAAAPAPAEPPDGPWVWPLAGGATVRGFDPPTQPWESGHRGVDLLGAEHDPVRAAGAGVVTYAGYVAGVGVVTVTHGELRSTYQPVLATVAMGDRVAAGDQIGTLTPVGGHCRPSACLHWGALRGDTYLDPLSLVQRAGRPRLLPLGEQALDPHQADRTPTGSVLAGAAAGALAGLG